MALSCYRCFPPKEPCVLVIDRPEAAPLCETCGVKMVDIVEKLPFPVEEFDKARNGETVEALEEEAAGEETGPAPVPSFEEVDTMEIEEIAILAEKLEIEIPDGMQTDEVREKIKTKLAMDQVEDMGK